MAPLPGTTDPLGSLSGPGILLMAMFVIILFLYAASSFAGATFAHLLGESVLLAQGVVLALPTLFLGTLFLSMRLHHVAVHGAAYAASVAMGFLNFAFVASLACWPLVGLNRLADRPVGDAAIAGTLLAVSVVAALYGLVNAARLRVTRYTVALPGLPAWWTGREVAAVSDIHVGVIRGPEFVTRIVHRLQELRPAAVFIPGDMFDGARVDVTAAVAPWAALKAPKGVYFVTGNHDELRDPEPYLDALTRVGVRVLRDETVDLGGLQIVGIQNAVTYRPDVYREALAGARVDRTAPSILLAHRPAELEVPAEAGISLQISGHTHAGQFPLWSQIVRKIYGPFAYGLNRFGSLQVVTSSGAGTGGPPFRFGTRAEIVILRLEPAPVDTAAPHAVGQPQGHVYP